MAGILLTFIIYYNKIFRIVDELLKWGVDKIRFFCLTGYGLIFPVAYVIRNLTNGLHSSSGIHRGP